MTSEPAPRDPLATDPFWGRLRQEHPDVTVVVLPPRQVATGPALSLGAARELAGSVDDEIAAAASAAADVGVSLVPGDPLWWAQDDVGAYRYRRSARAEALGEGRSVEVVSTTVTAWLDAGWVVTALDRPHPTLRAERPGATATLAAYPTVVTLEVLGDPVVLDDATLAVLESGPESGSEWGSRP